jgi:hypothetical protein
MICLPMVRQSESPSLERFAFRFTSDVSLPPASKLAWLRTAWKSELFRYMGLELVEQRDRLIDYRMSAFYYIA